MGKVPESFGNTPTTKDINQKRSSKLHSPSNFSQCDHYEH